MKAKPDEFVALAPAPWAKPDPLAIREAYEEYWQEPITVQWERGRGSAVIDGTTLTFVSDEPIPELEGLSHAALEPYGASDLAMLQNHLSITRAIAPDGPRGARALFQFAGALVIAGCAGIFLPNTIRLHSPRTIRRLTMNTDEQALTNFFVAAFDREGWMRTRGLTAFRLPEVETPIDGGMNAAYFRLMDVAAAMIASGASLPPDSNVQLGPKLYRVTPGPTGPVDDDIPINGVHGVLTLR